jgi:hypothetical protein
MLAEAWQEVGLRRLGDPTVPLRDVAHRVERHEVGTGVADTHAAVVRVPARPRTAFVGP